MSSAYQIAMKDMGNLIELANIKQPIIDGINDQLADIANGAVYAERFPRLSGETDDTQRLQRAIIRAEETGGVLILAPKIYDTSSTLRVRVGILIQSDNNIGRTDTSAIMGAEIRYGGSSHALDIHADGGGIVYGFMIERIRFSRLTGSNPDTAINMKGSEFIMRDVRINGGYKVGIKIDGSIGRIYDCIFSVCDVGLYLYTAYNVMVSGCNFWNNASNHVLMNLVSDSHIYDNWMERAQVALLLTNRQRGAGLLGTVIENNRFDTSIAGVYTNSRTFVIENANNVNTLFIQSSEFRNNLCYNELANHNIEILFTGLAATSYFRHFKIRNNVFYGAQVSSIAGNSSVAYVWLESNECRTTFSGNVAVNETSGTLGIVGMDQFSGDIRFRCPIRLATTPPVVYANGQLWYDTDNFPFFVSNGAPRKIPLQGAAQPDSVAADVAALRTDFNALLAKLRTAKTIAP